MPFASTPLVDEYVQISRRVTMGVTRRFITDMGLPRNIKIRYRGESTQLHLWNSETRLFKPVVEGVDATQFSHGEILDVELKEEISDEGYARNISMMNQDVPPFWKNEECNTEIGALYVNRNYEINYTYHAENMENANWFRNQILAYFAQAKNVILVDVDYYIIPSRYIWEIMEEVHRCQSVNCKDTDKYLDWLNAGVLDNSLTTLNSLDGRHGLKAFHEKQEMIHVIFTDTTIPDKDKRDKNPGYSMSFSLKFQMEKPYCVTVKYPVVVCNTMINNKYLHEPEDGSKRMSPNATYSALTGALAVTDLLYYGGEWSYTRHNGIIVPLGDDFDPVNLPVGYHQLFTGIVPIQYEGKIERLVGHLDIYHEYFHLAPILKHFMKRNPTMVAVPYLSPMLICGFVNDKLVNLNLDTDGSIYHYGDLTYKDTFRIVFAYPTHYKRFLPQFFNRVSTYPSLVEKLYIQRNVKGGVHTLGDICYTISVNYRNHHQDATDEDVREYLHKNAYRKYLAQFNIHHLGVWQQVVNDLLFDMKPTNRNAWLYDEMALEVGDSLLGVGDINERYMIIQNSEGEIRDKLMTKGQYRINLQSSINVPALTRDLVDPFTDKVNQLSLEHYRVPSLRTQAAYYIEVTG